MDDTLTKLIPKGRVYVTGQGNYLVTLLLTGEPEKKPEEKKQSEGDSDSEEIEGLKEKNDVSAEIKFFNTAAENKIEVSQTLKLQFGNIEYLSVIDFILLIKSDKNKMVCYDLKNNLTLDLKFPFESNAEHVFDALRKEMIMVKYKKKSIEYCKFPCMLQYGNNIYGDYAKDILEKLLINPIIQKGNFSEALRLYTPEPKINTSPSTPNEINSILLLLTSYTSGMSEVYKNAIKLNDPKTISFACKSPLCINLTHRCIMSLVSLLEFYYKQCSISKSQENFDQNFIRFVCIFELCKCHFETMEAVHMKAPDCLGQTAAENVANLIEKLVLPMCETYPFSFKPSSENTREALQKCIIKFMPLLLNIKYIDKAILLQDIMKSLEKKLSGNKLDTIETLLLSGLSSNDVKDAIRDLSLKNDKKAELLYEVYFSMEESYIKSRCEQFAGSNASDENLVSIMKDLGAIIENSMVFLIASAK